MIYMCFLLINNFWYETREHWKFRHEHTTPHQRAADSLVRSIEHNTNTHTLSHLHYERVACNIIIIIAIGMSLFIGKKTSWPAHLHSALGGMDRIADRCFLRNEMFLFLINISVFLHVQILWRYWFAVNCLSYHCFLLISERMPEKFTIEQNHCVMEKIIWIDWYNERTCCAMEKMSHQIHFQLFICWYNGFIRIMIKAWIYLKCLILKWN